MYYIYSEEDLRSICRNHIENLEKWGRIFIDRVLSEALGEDYFHAKSNDGNFIIKKTLIEKADKMKAEEPHRFPTLLDTLFLDDIIYILCKEDFFQKYFKPYLIESYPEGVNELRTFLSRLIPIRNKLSHTNPFSIREAEKCVCYSNDFIDCVKKYFIMKGTEKEFNIPTIIRVTDSLGNEYSIKNGRAGESLVLIDPNTDQIFTACIGDKFSLTLLVDPSFEENCYKLQWSKKEGIEVLDNGKRINVTITEELVGAETVLLCKLITTNTWHRYAGYDQQLFIHFKALPIVR